MLYVKYGKIGFMASEEMSFENVDDGLVGRHFLAHLSRRLIGELIV